MATEWNQRNLGLALAHGWPAAKYRRYGTLQELRDSWDKADGAPPTVPQLETAFAAALVKDDAVKKREDAKRGILQDWAGFTNVERAILRGMWEDARAALDDGYAVEARLIIQNSDPGAGPAQAAYQVLLARIQS